MANNRMGVKHCATEGNFLIQETWKMEELVNSLSSQIMNHRRSGLFQHAELEIDRDSYLARPEGSLFESQDKASGR